MTIDRIVEWLLDLDSIRLGRDAPLSIRFNAAWPGWLAIGCGLIAGAWIIYFYRKERTRGSRRALLAIIRGLLIAWVVAMLFQPSLVLQRNRTEQSHVVLLVDTSRSMSSHDSYPNAQTADRMAEGADTTVEALDGHSRLQLVQRALLSDDAAAIRVLLGRNSLRMCAFSSAVESFGLASAGDLPQVTEWIDTLEAQGSRTDLSSAIRQVIQESRGRRVAAIILASDGQSTETADIRDAIDLARGRKIPILPILIGSPQRPVDLAIVDVTHEERLFVHDLVALDVTLSSSGLGEPTEVVVRVVDARTGETVAELATMLDPALTSTSLELSFKPAGVGRHRYRVEVLPLGAERNKNNNIAGVDMTILDDRIRVLYVEAYPRYEYRYLKNALLREGTLEVQVLLLESDRRFVQEGFEPIRSFPDTPEALSRFDVVLFGDIDPRSGWLSEAQVNMLLDFVGNQGGGFGLIAGERHAPARFRGLPLSRLLPIRIGDESARPLESSRNSGFQLQLTQEGRDSRLFRFLGKVAGTETTEDGASSPFEKLPELYWCARIAEAKPGATVLATHPHLQTATGSMPVVVTGRYGAGKLFYLGTDDTWRWRRHTGEFLHDTFWLQVVRELMRSGHSGAGDRVVIRTDRREYRFGQTVQVQVEIHGAAPAGVLGDQLRVSVHADDLQLIHSGGSGTAATEAIAWMVLTRIGPHSRVFEGALIPPRAGSLVFMAEEIRLNPTEKLPTVRVRVHEPDLETGRPEANHQVLRRLAGGTGGRILELDSLTQGLAQIANRSVQIPDDVVEPLWDSKFALMVFLLLITTEWVLRKAFGLL